MEFIKVIGAMMQQSGFAALTWQQLVMFLISFVLIYLAIVKQFEPLLLLPIAFGMFLTNLPLADLMKEAEPWYTSGVLRIIYSGIKSNLFPCLIFMGIGAMTDFGPLIANPISLLLGAAAQFGIYITFMAASALPIFTAKQAAAIAIIGGADGPTSIYIANNLAPELLAPIAVAAYSYMALIPLIQPPIMKLLTTKKERAVKMKQLRKVSKTEKIVFPIGTVLFTSLLLPSVAPLLGMLMLGNIFRESGVVQRLSDTAQNALINIVTIMLGVTVGATANGELFLRVQTISIIFMGLFAFCMSTVGGCYRWKNQPINRFCRCFRRADGCACFANGRRIRKSDELLAHACDGAECGRCYRFCGCGRLFYVDFWKVIMQREYRCYRRSLSV